MFTEPLNIDLLPLCVWACVKPLMPFSGIYIPLKTPETLTCRRVCVCPCKWLCEGLKGKNLFPYNGNDSDPASCHKSPLLGSLLRPRLVSPVFVCMLEKDRVRKVKCKITFAKKCLHSCLSMWVWYYAEYNDLKNMLKMQFFVRYHMKEISILQ